MAFVALFGFRVSAREIGMWFNCVCGPGKAGGVKPKGRVQSKVKIQAIQSEPGEQAFGHMGLLWDSTHDIEQYRGWSAEGEGNTLSEGNSHSSRHDFAD